MNAEVLRGFAIKEVAGQSSLIAPIHKVRKRRRQPDLPHGAPVMNDIAVINGAGHPKSVTAAQRPKGQGENATVEARANSLEA